MQNRADEQKLVTWDHTSSLNYSQLLSSDPVITETNPQADENEEKRKLVGK